METADNAGRILIDGQEVYKLKGFKNQSPKIEKVKLIAGKHEVKVEVVNFRQENSIIIKKKIFSTQDWAKKLAAGGSVDVNFKITASADFANTVEMKEVTSALSFTNIKLNIFGCELTPTIAASDFYTFCQGGDAQTEAETPSSKSVDEKTKEQSENGGGIEDQESTPYVEPNRGTPPVNNQTSGGESDPITSELL